ncbi:rCG44087 [Rattus norvegicus]|uniref:RCG44087 n=1 Tax=Rattus norvegicus TaxID=10116 RepID=A6J7J1_RAT|nr:rCG44087 [Rattus norvegicus]
MSEICRTRAEFPSPQQLHADGIPVKLQTAK